jgi:hypothetical protein
MNCSKDVARTLLLFNGSDAAERSEEWRSEHPFEDGPPSDPEEAARWEWEYRYWLYDEDDDDEEEEEFW